MTETASAGAMPVVRGATPPQSYPSGPVFAAYRLPFPGAPGAREVGVCFDGEAGSGSDSSSGGTGTGSADKGGTTGSDAGSSATDDAKLGDAGKRAIDAERANAATERTAARAAAKRADAAEAALEALKLAGASDAEKAIAQAKKDGAAEVTTKWSAQVRRSEVKAALTGAGINASVLDLAINAAEFASLKVTDEGGVEGLAAAIDAFKKTRADLFKPMVAAGTADGGSHGTKTITREQLKKMSPEEINKAFDAGELAGVLAPPGR